MELRCGAGRGRPGSSAHLQEAVAELRGRVLEEGKELLRELVPLAALVQLSERS